MSNQTGKQGHKPPETYDPYRETAFVNVSVQMRDETRLQVTGFPDATSGGPFVSLSIGDGPGDVSVLVHDIGHMDRLVAATERARQELAELLGLAVRVEPCSGCEWCTRADEATGAGGSLWHLHDDPEYNLAHSHPITRRDVTTAVGGES